MGTRSYRVVIPYKQPSLDGAGKVYEDAFTVEAQSAREARDLAIEQFRRATGESAVTWAREIMPGDIRVEFSGRSIAEIQAKENSMEEALGAP